MAQEIFSGKEMTCVHGHNCRHATMWTFLLLLRTKCTLVTRTREFDYGHSLGVEFSCSPHISKSTIAFFLFGVLYCFA